MNYTIRRSILLSFGIISLSLFAMLILLLQTGAHEATVSEEVLQRQRPANEALMDAVLSLEAQSGELGVFLQTHRQAPMNKAIGWGERLLRRMDEYVELHNEGSEERRLANDVSRRARQIQFLLPQVMSSHQELHHAEQLLFAQLQETLEKSTVSSGQMARLLPLIGALTGAQGHETDAQSESVHTEHEGAHTNEMTPLSLAELPQLLRLLRQQIGLSEQHLEMITRTSIGFIEQRDRFDGMLLQYRERALALRTLLQEGPVKLSERNLKQAISNLNHHGDSSTWLLGGGMVLILLVSLMLGYFVLHRIGDPVDRLVAQTRRIAEGDFSALPPVEGDDEISMLAADFRQMVEHLRELTVGRDFFDNTLNAMLDGVIVCNADLDVIFANGSASRLLGCRRDDIEHHNLLLLERRPGVPLLNMEIIQETAQGILQRDVHLMDKHGNGVWCHIQMARFSEDLGGSARYVLSLTDVTDLHDAQEHMRLSATVFETTNEAIVITDRYGCIEAVNPAFERITGYSSDEVLGKNPQVLASGKHDEGFYQQMWEKLVSEGHWQGEIWNRRKDDTLYVEWLSIASIRSEKGELLKFIGVFSDITRRKETEQIIEYQARYDALTDLPNRRYFDERGVEIFEEAKEKDIPLAVLSIDLDGFKLVNDRLGHAYGDLLLRHVSTVLKNLINSGIFIARMGGDEFSMVICHSSNEQLSALAGNIVESLRKPIELKDQQVRIGCSIGISLLESDVDELEELLRRADVAMYFVKTSNKNDFAFFDDEMREHYHQRLQLEADLSLAVKQGELQLVYQPIVDTRSGKIRSMEALVRWNHPSQGTLLPSQFIPLAEKTGQIFQINEWVLEQACEEFILWRNKEGQEACTLNVNFSALHFIDTSLPAFVEKVLTSSGLNGELLCLEITESAVIQDRKAALNNIVALQEMGVGVSLDDFGTGYSSLSHLREFSVGQIKIDQSFVDDLISNDKDRQLVQSLIEIAHSLQLDVIAEGVEHPEQLQMLQNMGCYHIQGYHIARPAPLASFG